MGGGAGTDYCDGGYDGNTYDGGCSCDMLDAAASLMADPCPWPIPDLWDGY